MVNELVHQIISISLDDAYIWTSAMLVNYCRFIPRVKFNLQVKSIRGVCCVPDIIRGNENNVTICVSLHVNDFGNRMKQFSPNAQLLLNKRAEWVLYVTYWSSLDRLVWDFKTGYCTCVNKGQRKIITGTEREGKYVGVQKICNVEVFWPQRESGGQNGRVISE